ncbi:hypothetical protein [Dermatophilus congolensis]|uniref:hypothetical protein n=1 Tax=Dermatophilus congolensis TaxID=1863 RepID=UPI001AAFA05D|nr:hypothetical protein [Dermatophilus congolensis]MBO3143697.1 hypothetical protein [Dermatophilus congolensis]MBO3152688.1 hypothetical protein [Dermatophilus congolensis]MBO3163972.1 hypothetical protein [Dermatophilus congolensis]MBO3177518.1 hypothetical protein [Dermatophilus congolensis]MBO3184289.1 hypothetical protein [Dermatophilus congolensis]
MSAVTASILIGSTPRVNNGINPRWIALLHEGQSYAWQLLHLQLTPSEVFDSAPDAPPGVLWQASAAEDLAGELAAMLHLYATRTPEVVHLAKSIRKLQKRRVNLARLEGAEKADFENILRISKERGRELRLAAHIYPGSRLTDEHLLSMPDWELEVGYSAFSRDWVHAGGGRLIIREHAGASESAPGDPDDDEGEFSGVRETFIASTNEFDPHEHLEQVFRHADMTIADAPPPQPKPAAVPPAVDQTTPTASLDLDAIAAARARARARITEETGKNSPQGETPSHAEPSVTSQADQSSAQNTASVTEQVTYAATPEVPREHQHAAFPVTGEEAVSPWSDRADGSSAASHATVIVDVDAWFDREDENCDEQTRRRSLIEKLLQRN